MSIAIIVMKVTDALYLKADVVCIGKGMWRVEVDEEWRSVVVMLVRKGRARYV